MEAETAGVLRCAPKIQDVKEMAKKIIALEDAVISAILKIFTAEENQPPGCRHDGNIRAATLRRMSYAEAFFAMWRAPHVHRSLHGSR